VREAANDFMSHHGCPDIVVANAGISYGTLTECPEDYDAFKAVMEVNVCGLIATFQPFIEPMRAARKGALVGIASVAGYRGLPGAEAYCASKAAAIAYLESLRVRLAVDGIRVLTINPGYIDTPLTRGNPYPMPFLLTAETAAEKIGRAIDNGTSYTVLPWQMAIVARLLRLVPNWLYDRVLARAPHKPRLGSDLTPR
jgi:NAD(P)-dependent dehydrogenase (short-subunit alcohol dehydrogenase family)